MEKMENVDLAALVTEASGELLTEKRNSAANIIKQQLQRVEQLSIDVRNAEKQLKKKQEALTKAQDKMNKIIAGDWSLLVEKKEKDGSKKKNNNEENNEY